MTQRQKFELLRKFDSFELRRYEPCVVAEVEMNADFQSAGSGAFRYLFNYISKGNDGAKSIAMTAPVIATTDSSMDSQKWTISFVMPAGSKLEDMPLPTNEKVTLLKLSEQECVSISFKGKATERLAKKYEDRLRQLAESEGIALSEETRIGRFDPPFKPGFLQYNEIVIPCVTFPN
jgi:hypothetical protein